MKSLAKKIGGLALVSASLTACSSTATTEGDKVQPLAADKQVVKTFARFVPERKDDFAWENDLVAFRSYGPANRARPENSGVDCWLKRVNYSIIDLWYGRHQQGISYHKDHGEGLDNYHVGTSMGCGSTGVWLDNHLFQLETYASWKVLETSTEKSVFQLEFKNEKNGVEYREVKTFSIALGERLYRVDSQFFVDGKIAPNLEVVVGVTTHNEAATVSMDLKAGWVAAHENLEGSYLGTAVAVGANNPIEFVHTGHSKGVKDKGDAMIVTKTDNQGRLTYWSGYGWEKQGVIKNSQDWTEYLNAFIQAK
ncbi:DUF4861 family protein [Catenovulum maritimum]|uniref:DUF4861 domain-containing protein n=1 Tax=Catenovulum maritimum TaxID=1513271 RepID=A0A0J8GLP7_9ALTE|nr:DUF4861 family protein [Catenovulum maritimum]KMT63737.1 hypothetical protein XM47_18115 [Catenovulum maritimum]